jgi:hypothetical protein
VVALAFGVGTAAAKSGPPKGQGSFSTNGFSDGRNGHWSGDGFSDGRN